MHFSVVAKITGFSRSFIISQTNPFNCQITGNNLFLEIGMEEVSDLGGQQQQVTALTRLAMYVANWSIELVLQIIFPRNTVDLHHLDFIP